MATQLQIRRGTNSQVAAFTGAEGEIVVNTTNDSVHVNDGSTAGGFEMARADLNNVSDTSLNAALTGNTVSALTITTLTLGSTAITATGAELNILDGVTATATELNLLDGVTATTAELNYVDGVTSAIQTQINTKAPLASPTFTGTATMDGLTVDSTTGFSWLPVSTAGAKVGAIGTGTGLIINTPSVNSSFGSGLAIDGSYASDLSSVNVKAFGPKFSSYGSELNLFTSDDTSLLKRQTIASNGDISFYEDTGTTPKLFWDASAESLGIGTSSPSRTFHSLGASGISTAGKFEAGGSQVYVQLSSNGQADGDSGYIGYDSSKNLTLFTDNTERMRIPSTGGLNVINGSGANAYIEVAGNNNTPGSTSMLFGQDSGNYGYCWNRANQAVLFGTNGTERMRIDASGNLLVGCTALPSGGAGGAGFETGQSSARTILQLGTTTTSQETVQRFYNPNGNVGEIKLSGLSTSYVTSSDYRLKENVVAMSGATDRLKQLKPSRFNFIADADTTVDGFLAHEVQDVVPEAITGAKDAVDADGNPDYQGIDQSKLVPLLVATIQELEARLTALENN
jgi:hypothetical protein